MQCVLILCFRRNLVIIVHLKHPIWKITFISMLRRAMSSHSVFQTQFYAHCAFETLNMENYFHLIYVPQSNVFTLCAFDAMWWSLCIWSPKSRFFHLSICMLFRAICPQLMLLTQFLSLCIWNLQSGRLTLFQHFILLRAMRWHMVLLTQFYSSCACKALYLQNDIYLSIFLFLRAMCSHFVLLTQCDDHCAFETPNMENYLHLNISCSSRQCVHNWCFLFNFISIVPFRSQSSEKRWPLCSATKNDCLVFVVTSSSLARKQNVSPLFLRTIDHLCDPSCIEKTTLCSSAQPICNRTFLHQSKSRDDTIKQYFLEQQSWTWRHRGFSLDFWNG